VDRAALGHIRRDLVAEIQAAQVGPQSATPAEQDRGDRDVQVVDQSGAQEGARGADATADAHVQSAGSLGRLGEHVLDGGAAEVERRFALHRKIRASRSHAGPGQIFRPTDIGNFARNDRSVSLHIAAQVVGVDGVNLLFVAVMFAVSGWLIVCGTEGAPPRHLPHGGANRSYEEGTDLQN
jgi:hypothetical protein